jgi:uncharacterized protein with ParB-like and HNH nuclease domain
VTLQDEIDRERKLIQTDSYPISIGELISMYNDGELYIHPDFQRYIRWKDDQKSKFIESILLGIPIPPIFVSQEPNGVWDVIDGLQRLATIFGFVGVLRDENDRLIPPTKLATTKIKYLPALQGKIWKGTNETVSFTDAQRLFFKREKINVQIVKKESDSNIKYELFQRINSLGSHLSDQELRNCVFIMKDKNLFKWIDRLSVYPPFVNCLDLSEKDTLEKYNQEIVSRFFVIKNSNLNEIKKAGNFAEFITDFLTKNWWGNTIYNLDSEETIFKKTFDILDGTLREDSFKKYDFTKERCGGRFLVSAFEAIAIGLAKNIDSWELTEQNKEELRREFRHKIKALWSDNKFTSKTGVGGKFNTRIPAVVPLGINLFRRT